MEKDEAYEILGSWEWDVKLAAHELVKALMMKEEKWCETNCRACSSDCLFNNNTKEEWKTTK